MRLLTALVAFLSVASAITNGKQSESMKVNSTGGSILLAAKVAAFGEFMKAAADPKGMDTYALLEEMKINPADVASANVIFDKIIADVKAAHGADQKLIDDAIAAHTCTYQKKCDAGAAECKDSGEIRIDLDNLNALTGGITQEKTAAETGSISLNFNFAQDTDGSVLRAGAVAKAEEAYETYDVARTKLANHLQAIADTDVKFKDQTSTEDAVHTQCTCDAKSQYDAAVESVKGREATRKRDHELFGFLKCIMQSYEGNLAFGDAKLACGVKDFAVSEVTIDYRATEAAGHVNGVTCLSGYSLHEECPAGTKRVTDKDECKTATTKLAEQGVQNFWGNAFAWGHETGHGGACYTDHQFVYFGLGSSDSPPAGLDLSQHGTVLANDAAGPSGLKYGRAWNMKDHPLRVCKAL